MPVQAPPSPQLCASVDVGTNSVKMTVADLSGGGSRHVYGTSAVTRIGEGMTPDRPFLREAPMRRSVEALEGFSKTLAEMRVTRIAAVGTAALRDAENRDDFLARVKARCGFALEVIPGEEEARLSYLAVRKDPLWRTEPNLRVIDIGGGSTEVIQGEPSGNKIASRISVNLGAVKLTEAAFRSDPPKVSQLLEANRLALNAVSAVSLPSAPDVVIVGVGGTMTNLAAMELRTRDNPDQIHNFKLTQDAIEDRIAHLAGMTLAERETIPGLDGRRADIILAGAILLSHTLSQLGTSSLSISTRGLRWGLIYDRFGSELTDL